MRSCEGVGRALGAGAEDGAGAGGGRGKNDAGGVGCVCAGFGVWGFRGRAARFASRGGFVIWGRGAAVGLFAWDLDLEAGAFGGGDLGAVCSWWGWDLIGQGVTLGHCGGFSEWGGDVVFGWWWFGVAGVHGGYVDGLGAVFLLGLDFAAVAAFA